MNKVTIEFTCDDLQQMKSEWVRTGRSSCWTSQKCIYETDLIPFQHSLPILPTAGENPNVTELFLINHKPESSRIPNQSAAIKSSDKDKKNVTKSFLECLISAV